MVLLESFGLAANELFSYNRENFQFDMEQRLKKDMKRVNMQIERFDLFRQDIEDLVKLTVDKMDMYHLVAALFLGFTLLMYTEGRLQPGVEGWVPSWYLGVYFLSVAGAWIYLLLAVWLSMYASVCAHSFGTRLRTRYVRLPIPTFSEINNLTAQLQDFERQGVQNVLRLPFVTGHAQHWQDQPKRAGGASSSDAAFSGPGDEQSLGQGVAGFTDETSWLDASASRQEKHVQMFRKLQSKWQCYDAYSRVAMSLGVNQILQSVCYFVIALTCIEHRTPMTGIALTLIFQAGAGSVLWLDIVGIRRWQVFLVQASGALPAFLVWIHINHLDSPQGVYRKWKFEEYTNASSGSVFCTTLIAIFLVVAIWFEMLLFIARPSSDSALVPRHFRAVLFLDVFGDADYDPTNAEHEAVAPKKTLVADAESRRAMAAAHMALTTAHQAVRRWAAVPSDMLSRKQWEDLKELQEQHQFWHERVHRHRAHELEQRGVPHDPVAMQELKRWDQLTRVEQQEDRFNNCLLGPIEFSTTSMGSGTYYFILEENQPIQREKLTALQLKHILTLSQVDEFVKIAVSLSQAAMGGRGSGGRANGNGHSSDSESMSSDDGDASDGTASSGGDSTTSGSSRSSRSRSRRRRRAAQKSKEKVLRAERLPWKVIRGVTRALQLCWVFSGVVQLLIHLNIIMVGGTNEPSSGSKGAEIHGESAERRRLLVRDASGAHEELDANRHITFRLLEVDWPHGAFFQPETLLCTERSPVVGSSYRLYNSTGAWDQTPLRFNALPSDVYPSGTVRLCDAHGQACLHGAPHDGGVALWTPRGVGRSGAIALQVSGPQWHILAGGIAPCESMRALLPAQTSERCLILAGWDGEQLPVAVVPLPARSGEPPASTTIVKPSLAAPVVLPAGYRVLSLHYEPVKGNLWALLSDGRLQAWDILNARSLGRWLPHWPRQAEPFAAAAVCELRAKGGSKLLVAGMGGNRRAGLMWADAPSA